jgi:hypothetical protein
MEHVDYWKMKGQAAAAESAADTYPSGRCSTAGRLYIETGSPFPHLQPFETYLAKS